VEQWTSASEEMEALRRSAWRSRCAVRYASERDTPHGRRAVAQVDCANGWGAAAFLLASAIEDSKTAAARSIALELRSRARGDDAFARAVFRYVIERVQFVREPGEVFARSDYTLATGAGDCDDHARVVYALLVAGGLPARLAYMHKPGEDGPRHVVAQAGIKGRGWAWLETTIAAEFGEHPYAAAERLGVVKDRADIAREVRVMTEKDLRPVPAGYDGRTSAPQLRADAEALRKMGFLCDASAVTTPSDPVFRRAVLAFQRSRAAIGESMTIDGLIGPQTRTVLGTLAADRPGGPLAIFTHARARDILAEAYRAEFGREPSQGELDFGLATAYFESGYGRAGAATWAALGQFARYASEGLYNWGALQTSKASENTRPGKDAGRVVHFYVYRSDVDAARAFLRSWGGGRRGDVLAAAATGDALQVSAAMKRHGYYEGFHVPPGGLTTEKTRARGFVEESSAEEAHRKNVADYAGALERYRRVVTGPGGVPDPSPDANPPSVLGGAVALLLVAGAIGGAFWLAGYA